MDTPREASMNNIARTDMVTKLPGTTKIKVISKGGTLAEMMNTINGTNHNMNNPIMTSPIENMEMEANIIMVKEKDPKVEVVGQEKEPITEERITPGAETVVGTEILTLVMGGTNEETARRA